MAIEDLNPEELRTLQNLTEKIENGDPPTKSVLPQKGERKFGEAPAPNPAVVQRVLPPDEWVKRQIDTLTSVGEANYLQGIKAPRKDPIKAGIAAQDAYVNAMKDPEVLARRKTALEKTNIDEWVAMAETLGASKLVEGVRARQYKVERFVGKFQPLLKAHLEKIDKMPNATDADREKRMLENKRGLQALKGKA